MVFQKNEAPTITMRGWCKSASKESDFVVFSRKSKSDVWNKDMSLQLESGRCFKFDLYHFSDTYIGLFFEKLFGSSKILSFHHYYLVPVEQNHEPQKPYRILSIVTPDCSSKVIKESFKCNCEFFKVGINGQHIFDLDTDEVRTQYRLKFSVLVEEESIENIKVLGNEQNTHVVDLKERYKDIIKNNEKVSFMVKLLSGAQQRHGEVLLNRTMNGSTWTNPESFSWLSDEKIIRGKEGFVFGIDSPTSTLLLLF